MLHKMVIRKDKNMEKEIDAAIKESDEIETEVKIKMNAFKASLLELQDILRKNCREEEKNTNG